MTSLAEQIGMDTVKGVVVEFYSRVRAHPQLSVPFLRVHDWPAHIHILTHFWWVTLGGNRYLSHNYEVAQKHEKAGFTPALLVEWLTLFTQTVQSAVPPELAVPWLDRAQRMGKSLTLMHEWHQQ